jgi:hypothetical protein
MADSEAVRSRRKRLHRAGDHSLCRRCAAVRGEAEPLREVTSLPDQPAAALDPPAELRALASRLAAAHRADPANSLIARELRMTLADLMPKGKQDADADLAALFGALQA